MNLLAIDTATPHGSVALQTGDHVRLCNDRQQTHYSTRLYVWLETLKQEQPDAFTALDAIIITGGPGTFTGLRIGLATAKGLAMAQECPVVAFPTLEAVAHTTVDQFDQVCACINAGRGELAVANYRIASNNRPKLIAAMRTVRPDQIASFSDDLPIAGPGTELLAGLMESRLADLNIQWNIAPLAPALLTLCQLDNALKTAEPGNYPELNYIRAAVS